MKKLLHLAITGLGLAMLSACSVSVVIDDPVPTPVDLDGSLTQTDPIRTFVLAAGADRTIDVRVPSSSSGQVIFMTTADAIVVRDANDDLLVQSESEFSFTSAGIVTLDAADSASLGSEVQPTQSVSVSDLVCVGPCAAIDPAFDSGTVSVTISNDTTSGTVELWVVEAPQYDAGEPTNDASSGARTLPTTEGTQVAGAVEIVGESDWFRAQVSGNYTFEGPEGFLLVADIFNPDTSSTDFFTAFGGEEGTKTYYVESGEYVRIQASSNDIAATAPNSRYFITLDTIIVSSF